MNSPALPAALWLLCSACAAAPPVINEFLAINHGPAMDDLGQTSDWIEIRNPGPGPVNLAGWSLTDEPDTPAKWVFPVVMLPEGALLVVRASGMDRRLTDQPLHTNFTLADGGEFLGLYSPGGVASTIWQPYPKQFSGISYGMVPGGAAQGYFTAPTPGGENDLSVLSDYVRDTHFSVDRGFFTAPFSVSITSATPGAVIRYTVDGSVPAENTGTVYPGPVAITTTTTLRARAFQTGLVPSNADTQSYLFPAVWKTQPDFPAGFSLSWGQFNASFKVLADYGMNTAVTNNATYGPLVIPAMTQTLPVICLTGSRAEIFGDNGIHGSLRQSDAEVPIAVEYFDPLTPGKAFSARAGLNAHGGAVREFAKKAFRLDFTGENGDGALKFPLYAGSNAETFDQLVLRPGGHDSFTVQTRGGNPDANDLAFHAGYLRDQFSRRTELAAGLLSPRGRYVHLCINGLYWGLYDLHERPNAAFASAHGGGPDEVWDVLHHNNISTSLGPQVIDGNNTAWNDLQALCTAPVTTNAAYLQLTALLGPDRYIDHLLIRMWAGDHDWLGPAYMPSSTQGTTANVAVYSGKNWYALRDSRRTQPGEWQFFTWDGEISMGNHLLFRFFDSPPTPAGLDFPHFREMNLDLTAIARADTPAAPWSALLSHPEFRLKVADRAHRLLHNNGALSPEAASARMAALVTQLDLPIVAESARWGGVSGFGFRNINGTTYRTWDNGILTRDTHWRPEATWLRDTFCSQRGAILLNQLKARNLYPTADPVTFSPAGGSIGVADLIELTGPPTATIYYTTDGSDPRTPLTGVVTAASATYTLPLTTGGVSPFTVKARAYTGVWSPLTEMTFTSAVPPTAASLVLTQLHYHPPAPSQAEAALGFTDADDFEFLQLTNVSGQTVDLTSLRFAAGVDFDFAVHSTRRELTPGAFVVIGSHAGAFQARYGSAPDGVFANGTRLSNSGERNKLVRSDGTVIFDFTYNDHGDWPAAADGLGASLHLLAPGSGTDPGEADNWRADAPSIGGLPGAGLSYATWRSDFFTAAEITAGLGDPLADPDGDRLENLIEFVTKSNPRRTSKSPVKISFPAAGKVRFSYERRADLVATDYQVSLGISANMTAWTTVPPSATLPTDNATVELIHDLDLPATGRFFGRLRASPGTP